MNRDAVTKTNDVQLISLSDAARRLGVSLRTIHRLKDRGCLPGLVRMPGCRSIRVRVADLDSWVASGCPDVRHAKRGAVR